MTQGRTRMMLGAWGAGVALSLVGCASGPDLKKELSSIREELAAQRRAQEEQRRTADEMRLRIEQLEGRLATTRPAKAAELVVAKDSTTNGLEGLPVVKLAPREAVVVREPAPSLKAPPVDTSIPMREPSTGRAMQVTRASLPLSEQSEDGPVNLNAIVERTSPADAQYAAALTAYNDGDWKVATTAFKRFVTHYPKHAMVPNAVYWAGMAQESLGKCADALTTWKALLKDYPQHESTGQALFEMAQCESKLGHPERARPLLERLVQEHPSTAEATRARATLAGINVEG